MDFTAGGEIPLRFCLNNFGHIGHLIKCCNENNLQEILLMSDNHSSAPYFFEIRIAHISPAINHKATMLKAIIVLSHKI